MVQPLWKMWQFLQKLKVELPCGLVIPLLGKYPNELKAGSQRDTVTPIFKAALFTIAKT